MEVVELVNVRTDVTTLPGLCIGLLACSTGAHTHAILLFEHTESSERRGERYEAREADPRTDQEGVIPGSGGGTHRSLP